MRNPFAPGAGSPPPKLAGRDELRTSIGIALAQIRAVRPSKSIRMVGLRGVGKTVLLDRLREDAEACGLETVRVEAPENHSLPACQRPGLHPGGVRPLRAKCPALHQELLELRVYLFGQKRRQ